MMQRFDPSRLAGETLVATRRLIGAPAFTVSAVLLLGSGLGVGTAFFNLVNGALLKPLASTDKFVRLNHGSIGSSNWSALSEVEVARVLSDPPASFGSLNGHGSIQTTAVIGGMPQPVKVDIVLGHYFEDLVALPLSGRLLGRADESATAEPAAVVSERVWRTTMGSDPAAVGSVISVAGRSVTVVGVMAPAFKGLFPNLVAADMWVSTRVLPVQRLFGTLRAGVTFEQASAEIRARYADLSTPWGSRGLHIEPGLQSVTPGFYFVVAGLVAVGALVAAIAAASFTLLLLARAATNQAEIAVRLALGASARDITRLVALEVAVICTLASLVGLVLAMILADAIARYFIALSEIGTLALDPSPDWRVFLYMTATTLAIAFGISAVLAGHASRVEALSSMSADAGAGGSTPNDSRTRARLITAQVVVVTILLLVSALFARSTVAGLKFDPVFNSTGVAIAWIDQTPSRGDATRARAANLRVLGTVRETPGVARAALTTRLPGSTSHAFGTRAHREASGITHWTVVQAVTSDFFDVLRLPLVRGRGFTKEEESEAAAVAVVSEKVAAQFWPRGDALGQRLRFVDDRDLAAPVQIIGVVPDVPIPARAANDGDIFIPFGQRFHDDAVAIVVRGSGASHAALGILRATARRSEPPIGFLTSHTVDEELAGGAGPAKLMAGLSAMLGLVGLFMALTGLYGVTAQLAAHRRKELGIRKALGATNLTLCRMLARESTRILCMGIVPGVFFGVVAGFALRSRTFPNLEPLDAVPVIAVAALLLATGLLAAVLPFRRVLHDKYAALREL
jgi:putative ABC transport system permease protein